MSVDASKKQSNQIEPFIEEREGLIFAWAIREDDTSRPLDWKSVAQEWKKEGLIWLHMHLEHPTVIHWLNTESGVDESLLPYLLSDDSRPGIFEHESKLIMIMRGINANADSEPEDLISLRLYLAPDQLISLRRRRVQTMEEIHTAYTDGKGPKNASDFFVDVITREIERIGDHIEKLEEKVTDIERVVLTSTNGDVEDELQELQSDLIDLRRYLHPQRTMFVKLLDNELEWLDDKTYNRIRTQVEFHTRHVEDIDYCLQRAQVIRDRIDSRQTEQLNQKLYILAIVSCIFLPLSLITGLLGVNVAGIPFAENQWAFAYLSAGLILIAGLILLYFKQKKWF